MPEAILNPLPQMELPIIATKEAETHHPPCGVSRAHNLQPPPLPALKLQTTICDVYNVTVPNSRNHRLLLVISPLSRCLTHYGNLNNNVFTQVCPIH